MTEPRGRPESEPEDAGDGAAPEQRAGRPWRRSSRGVVVPRHAIASLLGAGVAAAVVVLGVMHRTVLDAGGDSLAGADGEWLALAGIATVAMWIAGTASLLGTLPVRPPLGQVLAVQFAASFVNHLMPAGAGGMAVNVRFLRRRGISGGAAAGAVGLNSLATGLTHLALLAGVLAVAPQGRTGVVPWTTGPLPHGGTYAALAAGALGVPAILTMVPARPGRWLRRRAVRAASAVARTVREMNDLKTVLRHPGRAAALWLGSLALPLLHSLILFALLRGMGAPVALVTVLVIYLSVSSLTAVVPSPGAIGGLDVALIAALAAAGASSAAAVGAVVGYRMITVWLPLPPAAFVFAVLLRRRVI